MEEEIDDCMNEFPDSSAYVIYDELVTEKEMPKEVIEIPKGSQ
jgi:hypothetical protein